MLLLSVLRGFVAQNKLAVFISLCARPRSFLVPLYPVKSHHIPEFSRQIVDLFPSRDIYLQNEILKSFETWIIACVVNGYAASREIDLERIIDTGFFLFLLLTLNKERQLIAIDVDLYDVSSFN